MNHEFPHIAHLDDVLVAIKDSPEFIVVEKDGYTVVNYVVATQDTFPNIEVARLTNGDYDSNAMYASRESHRAAIRRECRGLVFGHRGQIINRRYHKFFNVNERDETQLDKIDWNKPHHILEKLDGSMVSACYVNGHIRWMTKMGITDTSMEAEAFVAAHPEYTYFAWDMLENGITPIFEWCSNKNRIVLDYPEDRLVLTGLRNFYSGIYQSYEVMCDFAAEDGIPVVKAWSLPLASLKGNDLLEIVREAEDCEGIVVRFDDGHMVKIKTDWYVRIHKVKSLLGQERDVVKLILNNELDDLLPVLPKEDVERVEKFQKEMMDRLALCGRSLNTLVMMYQNLCDRKTFALEHGPKMNPVWRGMVFQFWDKECDEHLTYAAIVAIIVKNCGNTASYAKVKEAFLEEINYV